MSGFATVIGFMFSFFAIMSIFLGAFVLYQENLIDQTKIIESVQEKAMIDYKSNFNVDSYFYMSGRANFYINNLGSEKLLYKDSNDNTCFSFFSNNQFIPKDNFFMSSVGALSGNYRFIDNDDFGVLSINFADNFLLGGNLKAISCSDMSSNYNVDISKFNWWNEDWFYRKEINVENSAQDSIVEYQVEVNLNSSNFDFDLVSDLDDLRFVMPFSENLVLDLTFDEYAEKIEDFSKYNNNVILGNSIVSNEDNDPLSANGLLFNSLSFDGNDSINISANNSLLLDKEITIASWIKWDNTKGSTTQRIFSNGWDKNSFYIVNDGGVNQAKLGFSLRVGGLDKNFYSNRTIDDGWHFVVARYNSESLEILIDTIPSGKLAAYGDISTNLSNNYIASFENSNYYSGLIDEFKVFNFALSNDNILDLYNNNLRFKTLDFYVATFDSSAKKSKIFVKVPYINSGDNVTFQMYYKNSDSNILSNSNIQTTFSYTAPREVGYVVSDRISSNNGLSILSLYDNNNIYVGNDYFSLDSQNADSLAALNINQNDVVSMKYLGQVEGAGNGDDMIVPISWASKEFYFRGFRNNPDRFCMLSLWGDSNVSILDNGVSLWNGVVDNNGVCQNVDIPTNNALRINSSLPILVSYYGDVADDSFVLYPASKEDLFGVPSRSLFVASSQAGANVIVYENNGNSNTYNLATYGTISDGTNGAGDGDANAYRLVSNNFIGAVTQADGDGTEMTVFVPEYEMGTKFGSNNALSYIAIASPNANANCSLYDSNGDFVTADVAGVGSNGLYKYGFNVGNDGFYQNGGWMIECDKPVWPYYETVADGEDETNLFGHIQMRQYIYPEPSVVVS